MAEYESVHLTGCRRYFFLDKVEEAGGVDSVHLGVMKLERHRQCGFEPTLAITPPDDEGIVENAAVHPDSAVDVVLRHSRGAYDHTVDDVVIFA